MMRPASLALQQRAQRRPAAMKRPSRLTSITLPSASLVPSTSVSIAMPALFTRMCEPAFRLATSLIAASTAAASATSNA